MQQSYLVSGSNVLFLSVNMDPLSNVRTLLLQSHQHITCLIVETYKRRVNEGKAGNTEYILLYFCNLPCYFCTFVRVVIANVFYGVPHHLLVVHVSPRCDLSAEQHHASLTHRLCRYTAHTHWVLETCLCLCLDFNLLEIAIERTWLTLSASSQGYTVKRLSCDIQGSIVNTINNLNGGKDLNCEAQASGSFRSKPHVALCLTRKMFLILSWAIHEMILT